MVKRTALVMLMAAACAVCAYADEPSGNTAGAQSQAEPAAQAVTETATAAEPAATPGAEMPEAAALLAEAGVDTGCGGLLYANVDMWGGFSVKRRINGVEEAVKEGELRTLLCADQKGAEYYGSSEAKLIFSTVCNLLAAGGAAYCLIASGFFDTGRLNTGRATELVISAATVPVFVMTAEWFDSEAFNDRNRAMDVYNTNRSCGTAEQAR